MNAPIPGKGAQFLAARVGQDALTIAELLEQAAAKDARITELEAQLVAIAAKRRSNRPKG